ncbi:MAG: glycosyltransferase family 4 protein, partial [Crenarchaeota archaeon]|nr:glycosyltransferase family 4 protein [Thermoproteota archaeon]
VVHALLPHYGTHLSLLNTRLAVTFYDLVPLLEWKEARFKLGRLTKLYFELAWRAAARANTIITISDQTAQELVRFLKVPPGRIKVIGLGVDDKFEHLPTHREMPALGFFANFGWKKRPDIAIEAFRKLKEKGLNCQLILAGGKVPAIHEAHYFDVQALTMGLDNVTIMDHVPESQIVDLYNSFDVYLFPSDTEGFGLPILEAQRCGVPVLVREDAKIPPEVTQTAIKCANTEEMAAQAYRLLTEPSYRRAIIQAGIKYAAQFTWDRVADQTMEVYEHMVRSSRKSP